TLFIEEWHIDCTLINELMFVYRYRKILFLVGVIYARVLLPYPGHLRGNRLTVCNPEPGGNLNPLPGSQRPGPPVAARRRRLPARNGERLDGCWYFTAFAASGP